MEEINVIKTTIDWLLDVAKYIFTAVVITTLFGGIDDQWMIIVAGLTSVSVCIAIVTGLVLYNKKKLNTHDHGDNSSIRLHQHPCDSDGHIRGNNRRQSDQPPKKQQRESKGRILQTQIKKVIVMNIYTFDEILDRHIGAKGTTERGSFEAEANAAIQAYKKRL